MKESSYREIHGEMIESVDTAQLAALLGYSDKTIYRWVGIGLVPAPDAFCGAAQVWTLEHTEQIRADLEAAQEAAMHARHSRYGERSRGKISDAERAAQLLQIYRQRRGINALLESFVLAEDGPSILDDDEIRRMGYGWILDTDLRLPEPEEYINER